VNSKQLKGLTVISIADGEKLGTIDHIYLDPVKKQVAGFGIHEAPGHQTGDASTPTLIDVDDIHSLGPDAITLSDKGAIRGDQTRDQLDALLELDHLTGLKAVTEGGTHIGGVASVDIDDRTFQIRQLEVSPGFFKSNKHVAVNQITSIGSDLVIVDDAVLASDQAVSSSDPDDDGSDERRFVVGDITPAE
jgi:uncharacterized protein YrrD